MEVLLKLIVYMVKYYTRKYNIRKVSIITLLIDIKLSLI